MCVKPPPARFEPLLELLLHWVSLVPAPALVVVLLGARGARRRRVLPAEPHGKSTPMWVCGAWREVLCACVARLGSTVDGVPSQGGATGLAEVMVTSYSFCVCVCVMQYHTAREKELRAWNC